MIVHHERYQCLECSICGEVVPVRRRNYSGVRNATGSPEVLLLLKEEMAEDHKPCEEFVDDPDRAKAERCYLTRMRSEMRVLRGRRKGK